MDCICDGGQNVIMATLASSAHHRLGGMMSREPFLSAQQAEEQAVLSSPRSLAPMPSRLGGAARRFRKKHRATQAPVASTATQRWARRHQPRCSSRARAARVAGSRRPPRGFVPHAHQGGL